uniref:Peptidase A1 domain-containing protein n=1 Tax=Opuntia streptacantha TaxID=393608 RepID=A0A7C8ZFG4_OPUST
MGLRAVLMLGLCIWQNFVISMVSGNAHFRVEHKFRGKRTLKELRDHDARRHGRMLGAVDVPLGGNWQPSDAGLYFTRIGLGDPPKEFHVQLDTGSQVLWVNGASCDKCPRESGLGIKLNFYDANSSSTAKLLTCGDEKCTMMYQLALSGCNSHMHCEYQVTYGDGSITSGYFVEDSIHFDKVSGNQQTTTGNGSVVFGCAANQVGELTAPDAAVDGILGFGQRNSSVLSQLAAAGKVKRMFSHCLDTVNGGGIFSIGQLVEPKLNATAPLIPHKPHYYIFMKSVEVAGDVLELSTSTSRYGREAMVDSGTTLVHLPDDIYEPIMEKILSQQPNLQIHIVQEQFKCFQYSGK